MGLQLMCDCPRLAEKTSRNELIVERTDGSSTGGIPTSAELGVVKSLGVSSSVSKRAMVAIVCFSARGTDGGCDGVARGTTLRAGWAARV